MTARSDVLRRIKIDIEDELNERVLAHPFYRAELAHQPRRGRAADEYAVLLQDHLKRGTELTRGSYAPLFDLLDHAYKALDLDPKVRLFKATTFSRENATIEHVGDQAIISFESGILSTFDRPELIHAIIGHELGHYGYGHAGYPVHDYVHAVTAAATDPRRKSRETQQRLKYLSNPEFQELLLLGALQSQISELNADRAGLIARPDLAAAIEASMLMTAGAADRFGRYDHRDYLQQARELASQPAPFAPEDLENTHPDNPRRALALEYLYSSDVFRELTGVGPASVKLAEFSRILPRLVPLQLVRPALSALGRVSRVVPDFIRDSSPVVTGGQGGERSSATATREGEGTAHTSQATEDDLAIHVEWVEREGEETVTPGEFTHRQRAEFTWVLASIVATADGKVTPSERAFFGTAVRPRALAAEVTEELANLSDEAYAQREEELFARARGAHGRTKVTYVKLMIGAAKSDRKVEDAELRAIREAARRMDALELGVRELRNVFGTRIDTL